MFVRICSFPPFTQISYQLCRTGPGPSAESPGLFQMCSKDTDRQFQGPSHHPAPLSFLPRTDRALFLVLTPGIQLLAGRCEHTCTFRNPQAWAHKSIFSRF